MLSMAFKDNFAFQYDRWKFRKHILLASNIGLFYDFLLYTVFCKSIEIFLEMKIQY